MSDLSRKQTRNVPGEEPPLLGKKGSQLWQKWIKNYSVLLPCE